MINKTEKVGQIDFLNNGNAYVRLNETTEIFVFRRNTSTALHMDTVRISLIDRDGKKEGKVEEVLSRFKTQFVGTVQQNKNVTFVIPDNAKCPVDFLIPEDYINGATDKQKVVINFLKWKEGTKSPYGEIVQVLGEIGNNNVEMNSIMYEYGLPIEFPKPVELEAEKIPFEITEEEISKRKDLRIIDSFTIDGVTAKDFDDALSYRKLDNGNVEICVHIADVSFYVKEDTLLYNEAIKRATSVYLVDRAIPMLPEKLSNGVCSLRPNEDKLTCSAIFEINSIGEVVSEWFGRTIIRSCRRFTYDEVQLIIEGGEGDLKNEILELDKYAKIIRKSRIGNGLDIDSIEVTFRLDEDGKPLEVINKENKSSNKLIEEFMLLANRRTSEFVHNKTKKSKVQSIYRVHDKPNQEKIENLSTLIQSFGYNGLDINKNIKPQLNQLLIDIKGNPEENMISTIVVRSQCKAKYDIIPSGHYGLGFQFYSHWTSPIRRASDLIFHKILLDVLDNNGYQTL